MRILALNWQDLKNPQAGGAEVHLQEILKRLVSYGHQVDLLCSNFPGGKKTDLYDGIKVYRHGSRFNFNLVAPRPLRKLIKANKYNVVIEDINKIPFYSPKYQKLPTLIVIHHLFGNAVFREINFILGSYIYLTEKSISKMYRKNQYMVVSRSTAEELERREIPRENIHVIENGIDKAVYRFDPEIEKFEIPTILYVGRVKKYKSIETIIKAMPKIRERVPEARLIIVGSGGYLQNLKILTSSMNLEKVVSFKGFVPQAEKIMYLRRSHLAVCASIKEGWGLTNIEANACGTTVIASKVPGLVDSVDEGVSGLLFEYGNVDQIADLAARLLEDDKYRKSLEMGGLRWAANFSWDKTARATEELLKKVVSAL